MIRLNNKYTIIEGYEALGAPDVSLEGGRSRKQEKIDR